MARWQDLINLTNKHYYCHSKNFETHTNKRFPNQHYCRLVKYFLEYGRDLDTAVKREMNSDLRRLMRILLTTEREEMEVNVAQAHKEAQVGTTALTSFVFIVTGSSTRELQDQSCSKICSLEA
jgi:hypothetical protein